MMEGAQEFFDKIKRDVPKDIDAIASRLATFTDRQIIGKKFDDGFDGKGHILAPVTIKKKGHSKVGTNTGELKRQATKFTNWTVFRHRLGSSQPVYKKERFGLTDYSHFVRTVTGGIIDFLQLDDTDKVKLRSQVRSLSSQYGFSSTGNIRFIEDK